MIPTRSSPRTTRQPAWLQWTLSATAAAALVACGGGGGGAEPGPVAPVNQAPTVALDAPAANATVAAGASITITATAADSDGSVARVEFYAGATLLGEDSSAPYEFVWLSPTAGDHSITVRAIDNAGATATSAAVPVTVNAAPGNQAPTVAITAPATNFRANAPAAVKLVANAADSDGTVAEVKFYRIDTSAPIFDASTLLGAAAKVGGTYELDQTLAAGTYDIVAQVKDDAGATTTSNSVRVIVNALPSVNVTSPAAGATIKVGSNVTLRATAADADGGSIGKVEFLLNGTVLGEGTRVGATDEYTLAWNNVPVGAATIVARATDNDNAVQSSASVSVNVAANVPPTVTLDNPTAGTNAPTNLVLSASASDSDGSVASVQFFNGATLLGAGTLAAGKYTLTVPIAAAQPSTTYVITARATDDQGVQTTTASKSITVAANVPPAVALTSAAAVTLDPGNAPKTLALTATATDSDGIAKVEFFNGAAKIGEATAAPFTVNWANVAAGSYSITAKATDNAGSTTTTAAQALTVTPNVLGNWATLNAAQKAGLALTPNKVIGDAGDDAGEVMTVIGINVVVPGYNAAVSQAVRKAADLPLAAGNQYVACPGGGKILVQAVTATQSAITFGNGRDVANCRIDGYAFAGGGDYTTMINGVEVAGYPHVRLAAVQPPPPAPPATETVAIGAEVLYRQLAADRFSIELKSPKVDGPGTPVEGQEPYPRNAISYGYIECTVVGATKNCLTNSANSFFWGYDLAWTNWLDNALVYPAANYATDDTYSLSGTLRICQPDPQVPDMTPTFCQSPATAPAARHLKFENMTTTSGRAIIYGSNGWSVVTRLTAASPGVERVQVLQYIGGTAGTAKNYRCPVNAQGFFACVAE